MLQRAAAGLLLAAATSLAAAATPQAAPPMRFILPSVAPGAEAQANYFPQLLRLALEKTAGPFSIEFYPHELTTPRRALEIRRNGVINIMWDGTDAQRERELLPIRISLVRDLNDYRVFLIRKEDAARFRAVRTLDDLRQLSAGAGVNWPSVDVLRHNGLKVETAVNYNSLFPMLKAKRFDYMPRGVHEAWAEEQQHGKEGLMVEPTIFLHYKVPFYFFVSRENRAMADRVEKGLKLAMADGSYDKLLNGYPAFRRALTEIAARKRKVFELELPSGTAGGSSR
ncbi:substrate-binding periplasmic protein [Pseudoduganella sp.]|uniref:substrate-binding periplasmic protein n=1 Tax=Pseudoduganella sp. TaxID=1880898 RepID=UPI0035AEBB6F